MKKVLLVSVAEHFGGIEKLEVEFVKYLSKNFKIDILCLNNKTFEKYEDEIKENNGGLYSLNISRFTRFNEFIYDYRLFKFLFKNKYDIIHINSGVFFYSFRIALIAKICRVKRIIVHSHSYEQSNNLIKRSLIKILNPFYTSIVDEYLTCSKQAEKSLFAKKFIDKKKIKLVKNGIDVEKYRFNEEIRKKYRSELQIDNKTVYGHVGRFSKVKNHDFLINIFYEIQKKEKESILLLVGEGENKKEIMEKVKDLNIEQKVIFLGFREDVNNLLNVMDIFIFPSLHEGLGIAAIEAQTNGLIAFCSTNIPIEAKISDKFKYFNLDEDVLKIAEKIRVQDKIPSFEREKAYRSAVELGYDISDVCTKLKLIYDKLLK